MKKSRKSGFTLVELMVVAAIIAILAAIIIPLLMDNKETAVEADGKTLAGATMNAAKSYYARTGEWSQTLATVDSKLADETGPWTVTIGSDPDSPTVAVSSTASINGFSGTLTLNADGTWTDAFQKHVP